MEDDNTPCSGTPTEPSATGLSVLADPEKATLDIVFVHGFKGHPVRTWTHKTESVPKDDRSHHYADGGERPAKIPRLSSVTAHFKKNTDCEHVYWPRHLIPATLPTARVLVYGYDTNVRHSLGAPISKSTVYDIASDFLKSLEAERRSQPARPLVFVAHSLGGIVVKEALRRSHGFENYHNHLHQIYKSTAAILFFGTPHGGADPRGLIEHIAEKAVRAAGFTVNEQVVNTLLPTSERLRELRDDFAPMARQNNWIIYSFQEQYGVQFLNGKKVVEDVSSCIGESSLEMTQHIANNHMDMCRFSGLHDVEYRKVVAALELIQKRIAEMSADTAAPEIRSVLSESRRQSLMESLRYQALDARYATIKTAHTRTCRWLLKKSEYQDWLDVNKTPDHHGFLWIRGKPGSGKSTLTKFAVENARKATSETVISFFFNARGEDLEKSTRGMYQSLLFQILKAIPDLQIVLDRFRPVAQEESLKWEEDDLQSLFESAIKRLGQRRLTCFIDALDECEEGQIRDLVAFLERLGQLAISSQIHFYVFLSSRHYPYISIRNGIQMTLEGQEGHDQDIGKYLGSELKAGRGEQVEAIREEILKRSSGIFLWVALVVQILNKEYDHGRVHALRRRLREIPDGLDKLFEDILTRDQENMGEMVLCLQWILYAKRPLKRDEVYHAILSGTDPESLPALKSEEITAQDMERFIVSCSKGLAETTKLKAQTVQFIHESVRDYLLGKNGFNKLKSELRLDLSHDRLKQCCYDYMGIDTSAYLPPTIALPVASSEEARGLRELVSTKLPFLEYAVRNVLYHADVADGQGVSQKAFLKQFALSNWIMLDNLFEKYQIRRHTPNVSLTYIVAEKNFGNLVQIQIESDHDPGTVAKRLENERYGAPLYAALANANVNRETIQALFLIPVARNYDSGELHCGQSEQSDCEIERNRAAIKILVEKRPSLNPKKGETLIGWAASNGHEAVIKFLLARDDTNLNSVNFTNMYPLSLAAAGGHAGVVKLLLARDDIDLNLTDHRGRTPLSFAAEFGYEAIVKLLAKDDVDINSTKSCPLSLAAAGGHVGVVKLLLARNDINLNLTDQRGGTSLSYAAEFGHVGVFKLLLARNDINLNLTDQCGGTSLSYAAEFGHEAVVKLLLARDDVNINLTDRDSRPPLTLAAMYGHEAVVRLLLSRSDVDPNSKNNYGSTPLSVAVSRGYDSIVKLLLTKHDIDLNIQDNSGKTPLSLAAWNGHASLVDLLLSRDDVDPNLKDNYGQTPLSLTATNGYESIIRLLLARDDIDSNPTDKKGQTPLSLAAEYKRESIVGLLLAHINNDPNQKGKHG